MSRMAARGRYYPSIGSYGRSTTFQTIIGIVSKTLSSLTVDSDATTLTWSSTVPTVSFIFNGGVQTHDLTQYISGFNSSLYGIRVYTGTLPTGILLSTAGILTYDGTSPVASASVSYEIYPLATADWIARSMAPGVTYKQGFGNAAAVTPYFFDNSADGKSAEVAAGYISVDTTEGSADGLAALKIYTPRSSIFTGRNAATFRHSLNSAWTTNSQSFGSSPFYFSWRMKVDSGRLIPNGSDGWKFFICAQFSHQDGGQTGQSNSGLSFVGQDQLHRGFPQAYHYTPVLENFEETRASVGILLQNAIDNGGSPNSSRYCLYPGPYAGCWKWVANEWMAFKVKITAFQLNGSSPNNRFEMWAARQDATAWTKTHDFSGFTIGSPQSGYAGINGLHWLIYETNRENFTVTDDATVKFKQIIVSTSDIALPAVGA